MLIVATLLALYVSGILWFASTRTSDGDLREAVRGVQQSSCDAGNKIRMDLGSKKVSCTDRVNRIPK